MTHHQHECASKCGAFISCPVEDCWVDEPWLCPACEAAIRDEYFQQLEVEELKLTQPSTDRTAQES